jgi:hypothetical protein
VRQRSLARCDGVGVSPLGRDQLPDCADLAKSKSGPQPAERDAGVKKGARPTALAFDVDGCSRIGDAVTFADS